jgi:hypothetical protein
VRERCLEVPVDLSDLPVAAALLEGMGEVIDRSDTEVSAIVYGALGNLTPALITVRRDAGGLVVRGVSQEPLIKQHLARKIVTRIGQRRRSIRARATRAEGPQRRWNQPGTPRDRERPLADRRGPGASLACPGEIRQRINAWPAPRRAVP